jgi:RNA polymerase-interacting CarD/CdnL/TRCF family regulator
MGFRDWLGGRRGFDNELQEIMNPLLTWRLQHFVAFPRNEDGYIRHYFQFLDKQGVRNEFIVFHHQTMGGLQQQHTAYRKAPEEAYVLLSQRGPWAVPIGFLTDMGRADPPNSQSIEGHHVLGVSIGSRREDAAGAPEETKPKSPHAWERTPPPQLPDPEPEEAEEYDDPEEADGLDLEGFEVGQEIHFRPFGLRAKIVDLEEFESEYGDTHRFIIEFDDWESEMRVPVSRLHDLIALAGVDEDDGPVLERNGFRVDEHVVYPEHGVGKILAIEQQDIAGAKLEVFVIHFKRANMTLRVPTAKVENIGMRRLEDDL